MQTTLLTFLLRFISRPHQTAYSVLDAFRELTLPSRQSAKERYTILARELGMGAKLDSALDFDSRPHVGPHDVNLASPPLKSFGPLPEDRPTPDEFVYWQDGIPHTDVSDCPSGQRAPDLQRQ